MLVPAKIPYKKGVLFLLKTSIGQNAGATGLYQPFSSCRFQKNKQAYIGGCGL